MASINGMQVKEYLQALSDEGKIRVEKIGSGNWYWSFLSEEKKIRDDTLGKLKEEKMNIDATTLDLQGKLDEATDKRDDSEDGRKELATSHARLAEELTVLKEELNEYKDGDPEELIRKKKETKENEEKAHRWTDNLELLESWLEKALGGDKEKLEGLKRSVYGDEYVEGEGLKEL